MARVHKEVRLPELGIHPGRRRALAWTLAFVAALASPRTYAQLDGDLVHDLSSLEPAYLAALTATQAKESDKARSAVEALHALWRTFRRLHVDAHPEQPRLAADIERLDTHLAAAAASVDAARLDEAYTALALGHTLLQEIRSYLSGA